MVTSSLAIETAALVKTFGGNRAVDGIDLQVRTGTIYGLLGPNGAGKTTTVRILATLLRPDAGRALVLGHDVATAPERVRSAISLTGQFASVDEDLTGYENLVLVARLLGLPRTQAKARTRELLDAFDLGDAANRQVKAYSGGMRRRLDLAASIVRIPQLLFLDEPTTGLDPRSRNQVWDIIRTLVAQGTTVLLTTQYLEEADRLADRIAVIDHGRVIAEGTSAELKASIGSSVLHLTIRDLEQLSAARELITTRLGETVHVEGEAGVLGVQLSNSDRAILVLNELHVAEIALTDFSLGQPTLDEVFFALTGHGTEDADTTR